MRLAILSGLAESSVSFIPLCDPIPSSAGRNQLLAQAAAIVGVRRRSSELAALLGMIASRLDRQRGGAVRSERLARLPDAAGGTRRGAGAVRPVAPCRDLVGTARFETGPGTARPALAGRQRRWRSRTSRSPGDWWRSMCSRAAAPTWPRPSSPTCSPLTQPLEIQAAAAARRRARGPAVAGLPGTRPLERPGAGNAPRAPGRSDWFPAARGTAHPGPGAECHRPQRA